MRHLSRRDALKTLAAAAILSASATPFAVRAAPSDYQSCLLLHKFSGKYICSGEFHNGGNVWLWGPIPNGHLARYTFDLRWDMVNTSRLQTFQLQHGYSAKWLCSGETENGGMLWLWAPIPNGHKARYTFRFEPTEEEGYYYLLHEYSGKYVCSGDLHNGGNVWLWGPIPPGHEDRYKFRVELPTTQTLPPQQVDDSGGLTGSYMLEHTVGRENYDLTVRFEGRLISGRGTMGKTSFSIDRTGRIFASGAGQGVSFTMPSLRKGVWELRAFPSAIGGPVCKQVTVPGLVYLYSDEQSTCRP